MTETEKALIEGTSLLDTFAEGLDQLASQATQFVTSYFADLSERAVFPNTRGGQTRELLGSDIPVKGESIDKLLESCREIFSASRHNGHPRFFGYVASPSTPAGAFADLLASALNPNVTSWRSAPAATELERLVVGWLGTLIGYRENAHGLLTSGGSMANLIALLVAHRTKSKGEADAKGLWNLPRMTIYASDQVHMSVLKAAAILGFGSEQVRLVECDDHFRIDVKALRSNIEADLRKGLKPFCIVGSAGTVNTGAIDPLTKLADIASEYDLWFHVDGAYGAFGAMDARKRPLFAGLVRADSVSLDPHKWLYVPLDAGCLLVRDAASAQVAGGTNSADYITVHEKLDEEAFAFWDYSVELSRRFRALKIWFTLRYYGTERIAAAISKDNLLAEYLSGQVERSEDFELLAPVDLSICCFRYVPRWLADEEQQAALLDQLNADIMHTVQRGGKAYLSNATVNGKFALRACITNFRTTRADVDQTLEIIRQTAQDLESKYLADPQ